MRQFGVAIPGGAEHVSLRARTLHETGRWLVITDCSNAFNTVRRKAVLAEVVNRVPALMPVVAKCFGTRLADVSFRMDSGEIRTIACSCGVQEGDSHGAGNILSDVATGAEAVPRGVRGTRSGSLRVLG